MLARLQKIDGVETSASNHAGTLVRISATSTAVLDNVAHSVLQTLTKEKRKPVRLADDAFREALAKEKWYDPDELSAIEFRTLVLGQVADFAEAENLDKETADKLLKLAEEEWDRLAKSADAEKPKPGSTGTDWAARCGKFAAVYIDRTKDLLSSEQREKLRKEAAAWVEQLGPELERLRDGKECDPK